MENSNSVIKKLEGLKLSQVCFVHDYLQLVFEDYGVTVNNPLTVIQKNQSLTKETVGYADSLVGYIGKTLNSVTNSENKFIFSFNDETNFSVSLRSEDYYCPEAIVFHIDKDIVVVN